MNESKTILIVEDEPGFRRTYSDLFTHYGHTVIEAENGLKGWEAIQAKVPDLVLLDLVMPEMTGYELLDKLKQHPEYAKLPIIIFSVLGEQTDIQKALELGASDYIVKGFYSPQEVLGKVGKFLAKVDMGEATD